MKYRGRVVENCAGGMCWNLQDEYSVLALIFFQNVNHHIHRPMKTLGWEMLGK